MKYLTMRRWIGIPILLAALAVSGCEGGNIFGFNKASDTNVGDLILTGQEQLRSGKFAEAKATLERALALDDRSSEARVLHAEASLLLLDEQVSIVSLLKAVTDEANVVGANLPLYSPAGGARTTQDDMEKDFIYTTNITIVDDLDPISRGLTDGPFDSASVALDLAIAQTVKGILRLRDTNNDLRINSSDFFFNITRSSGSDFSLGNIDDVINTDEDVSNFNGLIKDLASGDDSIVHQVINNLRKAGLLSDDTSIDIGELEDAVNELGDSTLRYLIFNPNNPDASAQGDNDNDGRVNEEILNGKDDDGDGLIDEDAIFS